MIGSRLTFESIMALYCTVLYCSMLLWCDVMHLISGSRIDYLLVDNEFYCTVKGTPTYRRVNRTVR
jgi:hypothetical protein